MYVSPPTMKHRCLVGTSEKESLSRVRSATNNRSTLHRVAPLLAVVIVFAMSSFARAYRAPLRRWCGVRRSSLATEPSCSACSTPTVSLVPRAIAPFDHHHHHHHRVVVAALRSSSTDLSETEERRLYDELKRLSEELVAHDRSYYTPGEGATISDDEYDALARREAELCEAHPELLERLRVESPRGNAATRYGGRVGAPATTEEEEEESSTTTTTTEEEEEESSTTTTTRRRLSHLAGAPLLSLDNALDADQVAAWLERVSRLVSDATGDDEETNVDVIVEPKLDGLSLSLRYEKTADERRYDLAWGATRGDGARGEDVTDAVLELCDDDGDAGGRLPRSIADLPTNANVVEVRGEIVLPRSAFVDATDDAASAFANARNAASGILRRTKNVSTDEFRRLRSSLLFYAYDVVADDRAGGPLFATGTETRRFLETAGFALPEPTARVRIRARNDDDSDDDDDPLAKLLDYHSSLTASRPSLDVGVDGAVYKLDDVALRVALGASSRAPRWAVAHKFPSATAVATLRDVEVRVGRTGVLTPVAVLDPVALGDVTVTRATLHNTRHAREVLGGARVRRGASVLVSRAGDVIPRVLRRVVREDDENDEDDDSSFVALDAPSVCPACGAAVATDDDDDDSASPVLRCGGPELACRPRAVGALTHAFSRRALDVTGLSESRAAQLMDAGLLERPVDAFRFRLDDEDILNRTAALPGWGPKSARNLAEVAQRVVDEGVPLDRFVYSLNVRHVGSHASRLVAAAFGTAEAFLDAVREASSTNNDDDDESTSSLFARTLLGEDDDDDGVKGLGPAVVASLEAFSRRPESVDAAIALAKAVPVRDDESAVSRTATPSDLPWRGRTVVFSGSVPGLSRTAARDLCRTVLGAASTPGDVSGRTDAVVAGDGGGSKIAKAEKLGVEIVPAAVFLDLVEQWRTKTRR